MYPVGKLGVKEEEDKKWHSPPQHQECQPGLEYIMMLLDQYQIIHTLGEWKLCEGKVAIITGADSGIGRAK